jgi:hypothetical protein
MHLCPHGELEQIEAPETQRVLTGIRASHTKHNKKKTQENALKMIRIAATLCIMHD